MPSRIPAGEGPLWVTPGGWVLIGMLAAAGLTAIGTRRRTGYVDGLS